MNEVRFWYRFPLSPCLGDHSALWSQFLLLSSKKEKKNHLQMLVLILS